MPRGVEDLGDALGFELLIAGTGDLDRQNHIVTGLHQLIVDEVLGPELAGIFEIGADIGVASGRRIVAVEKDHRNALAVRQRNLFGPQARLGGRCGDAVGSRCDGGIEGFLLNGEVAIGEGNVAGHPQLLAERLGTGVPGDPERIGFGAVRDQIESLVRSHCRACHKRKHRRDNYLFHEVLPFFCRLYRLLVPITFCYLGKFRIFLTTKTGALLRNPSAVDADILARDEPCLLTEQERHEIGRTRLDDRGV